MWKTADSSCFFGGSELSSSSFRSFKEHFSPHKVMFRRDSHWCLIRPYDANYFRLPCSGSGHLEFFFPPLTWGISNDYNTSFQIGLHINFHLMKKKSNELVGCHQISQVVVVRRRVKRFRSGRLWVRRGLVSGLLYVTRPSSSPFFLLTFHKMQTVKCLCLLLWLRE